MPAEWSPHRSTWLTWPRPAGISFPGRYDEVPPVYAKFIRELTHGEDVNINVWDATMAQDAASRLLRLGAAIDRVHFHTFPSYEPWCRDHGPIFLNRIPSSPDTSPENQAIVDWRYNAWGGKYPPFDLDDAIPQHVANLRRLPLYSPDMILEGGAIDVNGQGDLLTTEACLLNPNRNPNLTRDAIETFLRSYLGVQRVHWLGEGIVGDDTDGHVDDLCRFVAPDTIVTIIEEDPADPNYARLRDNRERLDHLRGAEGRPFRILELPMPGVVEHDGQRLPASYANFYIANAAVIVPTYRHPNDAKAIEILSRCFRDRPVIGLDSMNLIWGLGSFHCISQQEPLPLPPPSAHPPPHSPIASPRVQG
ncbi:MAG: agmatine deiminase family protein [Verrucomicrobia bacterium]|nr:agmatine deiminase family protein [Verrucomicrobiota bacterium]